MQKDIDFLFEIGSLRSIARTWNEFLGKDVANVAEHTIRVAWIALTLAKYEGISDTGKIVKLALVHDISEIRTGDTNYISRQYTTRNEEKAIMDILEGTTLEHEFLDLWKEMEAKDTPASQIVKDADTLDVDLEVVENIYMGKHISQMWKAHRLENVQAKIYTKTALEMQKQIYTSNPHDWHFLSKNNRFNGGDMQLAFDEES